MATPPGSSAADSVPSSPPGPTSSPPSSLLSPTRSFQSKERRVPSVTPRRFRKFFTPRTLRNDTSRVALAMLDAPAMKRLPPTLQSSFNALINTYPIIPSSPLERRDDKRRQEAQIGSAPKRQRGALLGKPPELLPTAEAEEDGTAVSSSKEDPERGSLSARRKATLNRFFKADQSYKLGLDEITAIQARNRELAHLNTSLPPSDYKAQPIRKYRNRGLGASLLDREHGLCSQTGKQYVAFPAADPRTETADFYSDRHDTSFCTPLDQAGTSLPFSLASCHGAAMTAIGDEHGCVRFFSTMKSTGPADKVSSIIQVHDNAIMHLDFSADDCRLASACGDRSGRIMDVRTQSVAVELADGHWDSLRQVSFQPGEANGNVLASSDRAGRLQIWDLRCSSLPVQCFSAGPWRRDVGLDVAAAKTVNAIDRPHQRTTQGCTSAASVTALQWLPAGRQHLLLTGSEVNASIKLWDTRYVKSRRQTAETPVAVTPEPATHTWRSYGITSMALGSDAARLYAVCKDSTVYVYSTNHLLLGHAPELADAAGKRKPGGAAGLGPLYGLKHDLFRVGSFYVKCAVRHSPGLGSDLLAVGSSDACVVLFPTDERYMRAAWAAREQRDNSSSRSGGMPSPFALGPPSTPGQAPCTSSSPLPQLRAAGTPLVRGHSREVTVLSWSYHRALVSASDDCLVRQWQPNAARARHLRRVGEFGGERHLAGWADVRADWDYDDDDDAD